MPPVADPADIQAAVDAWVACKRNKSEAARSLGIPRATLHCRLELAEQAGLVPTDDYDGLELEEEHINMRGDQQTIRLITHKALRTEAEVLEHCQVDTAEWEVHRLKITNHKQGQTDADKNARIVSMVNITLELRRRRRDDPERAKAEVMELLKKHAPRIAKPKWTRRKNRGELMLEISVPDIHFGKLADGEETGEAYNLKIARSLYLKAHEHILNQACERYDIGQVIQVPSNDIMHFDGSRYTTTKGTRQDASGTWQRVYMTARKAAVDAVLMCREAAPVRVISHTDNHAQDAAFYLGDALDCYFHADPHTVVDSGPQPYKFHRHGNCLIGWGHGHQAKYPELQAIMARYCPNDYAECPVKEWHLGHLHKEMLIDGWGGMVFRRISSLSGADSWHAGMGYGSQKSAMGFVWSHDALEAVVYFTPKAEDYAA